MPRKRNAATAFRPAIDALRSQLACLEEQSSRLRTLLEGLEGLCAHAGEPTAAPGDAAVPSSSAIKGERKTGRKNRVSKKPDSPKSLAVHGIDKAAAPAKPALTAAVAEWEKILTSRAEAIAEAESVARDKDPTKLKVAIAARARLERRLGEILTVIDGRVRPLPGGTDRNARQRWKFLAQLSMPKFENALRQWQHRALAAIGVAPKKPAPAKAKPSTRPQQAMKLSEWREEPDGSRSRTLTAVDGGGAEAP
jgi:hypothetical protein